MIEDELKATISRLEIGSSICHEKVLLDASKCLAKALLEILERVDNLDRRQRLGIRYNISSECGPL